MYCIVDIETTGGNHKSGKITEIAIFKHDGLSITESYSSLVNPECSIPYFISNLTGITNEMVEKAPKFYEIAKDIIEFTEGHIFVAHNVSFDYGFIREEFRNLGYDFKRERICTVKSARKIFPGRKSYSLGKLCRDLGIELESHHRATDDAKATAILFDMILNGNGRTHKGLMEKDIKFSKLNPLLDQKTLKDLPDQTGVYYLLNQQEDIIYIGKSNNIRSRVHSHFRNDKTKKSVNMIAETTQIRYEITGSELVALLKESEEIKLLKPKYNRAQKRNSRNFGLFVETDELGYLSLKVQKIHKGNADLVLTAFKSYEEAKSNLRKWTERFALCQKYTDLHKHTGPCFAYQVKECHGACVQEEPPHIYNERVEKALAYLDYKHASFIIIDGGRTHQEYAIILVENGSYKGFGFADNELSISSIEEVKDIIEIKMDNKDVKQIIKSHLSKRRIRKLIPF